MKNKYSRPQEANSDHDSVARHPGRAKKLALATGIAAVGFAGVKTGAVHTAANAVDTLLFGKSPAHSRVDDTIRPNLSQEPLGPLPVPSPEQYVDLKDEVNKDVQSFARQSLGLLEKGSTDDKYGDASGSTTLIGHFTTAAIDGTPQAGNLEILITKSGEHTSQLTITSTSDGTQLYEISFTQDASDPSSDWLVDSLYTVKGSDEDKHFQYYTNPLGTQAGRTDALTQDAWEGLKKGVTSVLSAAENGQSCGYVPIAPQLSPVGPEMTYENQPGLQV